MNQILNDNKKEVTVGALLYIVTGIMLCIFNVEILTTFIQVLGVILLLCGFYQLYKYFIKRINLSTLPLIFGIPLLIIGFILFKDPQFLINASAKCTAILLIFNGIIHIQSSLVEKDYGYEKWKISGIYALLLLILGLALFFFSIKTVSTALKICGVLITIQGIGLLITQKRIKKLSKDYVEGDFTEL